MPAIRIRALRFLVLASVVGLAGCGVSSKRERECMARAMYFESNRSSDDGMLAVGTVVMNRLESGKYPDTICGVVGQKRQFAPGVLSKPMKEGRSRERAERMAKAVLKGKRHRGVGRKAMFFHTAGYNFPYRNMNYKVIAGGNAFYEKRTPHAGERNTTQMEVAQAARRRRPDREREVEIAVARPRRAARDVEIAAAVPRVPVRRVQPAPQPVPELLVTAAPPHPEAPIVAMPAPGPAPLLAIVPTSSPTSIEDLIALNGGL
jgi:spore germination cell wall hydrolase CwlJ-like protein